MSQKKLTLQDQLIKSGLASEAKAKKIRTDKRKQSKQQRKNKLDAVDEVKLNAQKAKAEQVEKDRELNQLRNKSEEQKALTAQIKQIVEFNRMPQDEEGIAYHFNDNSKVKKIYVAEAVRELLTSGRASIVKLEKHYEVVSEQIARKIQEKDGSCIIVLNEKAEEAAVEDDPYSAYQVPDDLIW